MCFCLLFSSYAKGDLDISYITSRIAGRHVTHRFTKITMIIITEVCPDVKSVNGWSKNGLIVVLSWLHFSLRCLRVQ